MGYAAFKIKQTPDGKWRLYQGAADMGVFDDIQKAKSAMQRIVENVEFCFDAGGNPIEAA